MPLYVVVVEADRPTFEVKGGKVVAVPFEADSAALAVMRALSRLADEDSACPVVPQAIEPARLQRPAS